MPNEVLATVDLSEIGQDKFSKFTEICSNCNEIASCISLCQNMEKLVNQDTLIFPGYICLWGDVGLSYKRARNLKLIEMETEFAPPIGNRRPYSKLTAKEWALLKGAGLSVRQKIVLFLYYWQAHSSREVANILNIHHSAVDALLRRAKNRLRRYLYLSSPQNTKLDKCN